MLIQDVLESFLSTRDVCNDYRNDLRQTARLFSEYISSPATHCQLLPSVYAGFADWLRIKGKSATTINNKLRQLKTIWYHAAELRLCEIPPRKLKRLRETPKPIQGWNASEFARLIRRVSQFSHPLKNVVIASL